MTATRRDVIVQGGWAVAFAWMPAAAQDLASPEVLPPPLVRTLMATAEAVTGVRPLRGHYEAYWQHQATHWRGRRELYLRFAQAIASSAASAGVADFAAADLRARAGIVEGLRSLPELARDFEVPVFQEMLAIFQRTDAWVQLGYESWPGSARGLDTYRRPPR